MRVEWERPPFGEASRARYLSMLRENLPDADPEQFDWPERQRAVRGLAVDGHGHLYVFPAAAQQEEGRHPVDACSAEGEPLASGLIGTRWETGKDDMVYGWVMDETTQERELVGWRLVEPF